jgi:hypothetical protein
MTPIAESCCAQADHEKERAGAFSGATAHDFDDPGEGEAAA